MRIAIEQTKVYKFKELSEEGQEQAIEKFRDGNLDYEWWDCTYEDANNIGLKITGFDLDRNRHATGQIEINTVDCAEKILSEHGENCGSHTTAKEFLLEFNKVQTKIDKLDTDIPEQHDECYILEGEQETLIEDFEQDLLECYSILLQDNCDYLNSDEAITETIECNDYEFTSNGNLY